MTPNAVNFMALAAGALALGMAAYYWATAFAEAKPWFPQPLQEELRARFAIDSFIWSGAVPAAARRNYLLSHVYGCFGMICLTILATAHGTLIGSLLFVGVTVLWLAQTWLCWRKYRRLR